MLLNADKEIERYANRISQEHRNYKHPGDQERKPYGSQQVDFDKISCFQMQLVIILLVVALLIHSISNIPMQLLNSPKHVIRLKQLRCLI